MIFPCRAGFITFAEVGNSELLHDNGEYVWQEIENSKWKKTESEGGGRGLREEGEKEPDIIRRNERSPDLVRE